MIVTFGKCLFGKVDNVPGKYHVAIFCWHFCYVPLVPMTTYLVLGKGKSKGFLVTKTNFKAVPIPFSAKAFLVAWMRMFLVLALVLLIIALIVIPTQSNHIDYTAFGAVTVAAIIVLLLLIAPYFIPGVGVATAGRARELEQLVTKPVAAVPQSTPGGLPRR